LSQYGGGAVKPSTARLLSYYALIVISWRVRRFDAKARERASRCRETKMIEARNRLRRPRAAAHVAPAALAILILAAASAPLKADCPYGDSSKLERSEIRDVNGDVLMCVDRRWIRNNDILAIIAIEKANLWTDCCGATDETDYVRAACGGQPDCAIPPTQFWAGPAPDPAARRHLFVRYHCSLGPKDLPTSHVATQAEEEAPLRLSCADFTHR
jgi:hypothetical protein